MITLFVSDLHLSQHRPEKIELFRRFLEGPALQADKLYILGDLFDDFWIGIDDMRPLNNKIIACLKQYAKNNNNGLMIMRGNRDFYLDNGFVRETGCKLIDDPYQINLDNNKILIMHGDSLCIDDRSYQYWKRFITNPLTERIFSCLPLLLRRLIAHNVRSYTSRAVQKKSADIIDVNLQTVIDTMNKNNVDILIHGHTHKQGEHEIETGAKKLKRIVLGDWYEKDCVLIHDQNGFRFETIADFIQAGP